MKTWKALFLMLVVSVTSFHSKAQVLLVSDIDDTIKISHVLATVDSVENTVFIGNHFLGMAELYQAVQDSHWVKFAYVSNAISYLLKPSHLSFLYYNSFPSGDLLLRPSVLEMNHKFKVITDLIQNAKPTHVILIGDNGEADPVVYDRIRTAFPQIPMFTFIHQLYSQKSQSEKGSPLLSGQIGFATAADLGLQMRAHGLIVEEPFQKFVLKVVPRILKASEDANSGEVAFPYWMDCRDFLSQNPITVSDPLLLEYQKKVQSRCSQGL